MEVVIDTAAVAAGTLCTGQWPVRPESSRPVTACMCGLRVICAEHVATESSGSVQLGFTQQHQFHDRCETC